MNKYIRTKDAVYEVDENDIDEKIRIFSLYSYEIYSDLKFNALILNQADKIEELCDEFIGVYQNIYEIVVDYRKWYKYDIVYGAIYTDKGLIYVAKLNEEGELELI